MTKKAHDIMKEKLSLIVRALNNHLHILNISLADFEETNFYPPITDDIRNEIKDTKVLIRDYNKILDVVNKDNN